MVIFGLAAMPVLGLFGRSGVFTKRNQDQQTAANLCMSTLKGLLNVPFKDVGLGSPVVLPFKSGDLVINEEVVVNNTTFKCRLNVTNVSQSKTTESFELSTISINGDATKLSAFKQFRRYDFRVEWVSRVDNKAKSMAMTIYKADLQ